MTISLHNVNKSFGEKKVLQDLSCTLKDKAWTLITGPSGCGKTTLFRILLGLEKADSGEIQGLTGRNSAVFQENRLCEELTTADNIRLVMSIHRNDKSGKEAAEKQINAALKELGLLENENQPVSELSGGMKRRCAIARAVLADADLYLLDEPFYGLDKKIKEDTMDFLIRHLNGKTVVLITHDKEAIEYLKSRHCVEREIILAPI